MISSIARTLNSLLLYYNPLSIQSEMLINMLNNIIDRFSVLKARLEFQMALKGWKTENITYLT